MDFHFTLFFLFYYFGVSSWRICWENRTKVYHGGCWSKSKNGVTVDKVFFKKMLSAVFVVGGKLN